MKRLLYTCALEAALMEKHHRIKFETAKRQNLYWDGGADFRTEKDNDSYWGEKYFVHPDFVSKFTIKEGDVVEFDGFIYGIVNSFDQDIVAIQCDDVFYERELTDVIIIRRNDKPFIMPQSQE